MFDKINIEGGQTKKETQIEMFPLTLNMRMKPAGAMALMEYNPFNISTNSSQEIKIITHEYGMIQLKGGTNGLPTMADKDILYYIGSHIKHAVNSNEVPSRWVVFSVVDYYKFMGKKLGGKDREAFYNSIVRLYTSYFLTNIESGGISYEEPFRIIEDYKALIKTKNKKGITKVAIKVSDWLMGIYLSGEMLTVPHEYFKLKPSLKPIYEHIRKHCGQQSKYQILIPNLNKKIGTGHLNPKYLKAEINKNIKSNKGNLLNYKLKLEGDKLTTYPVNAKGIAREVTDLAKAVIPGYMGKSTARKQESLDAMKEAENIYQRAIQKGWSEEIAQGLRYARIKCILE